MKTRIISAAVGIVLLLAILVCPYSVVFAAAMAALAAIAVWELLHNTGIVKANALTSVCMAFSVLTVLLWHAISTVKFLDPSILWQNGFSWLCLHQDLIKMILLVILALVAVLLCLRCHERLPVTAGASALFLTVYATAGFSALTALRSDRNAYLYLVLVLVIPWMSDTGAYFVGTFLGKHKMTPVISPKKSWEGFFGGWAVSVGSAVLVGVLYQSITGVSVNLLFVAAMACLLAPLSVCGDLFASVIKRQSGIKDYGNIMPGHGGVMDRFDSVLIIAPILYWLMQLLPVVQA